MSDEEAIGKVALPNCVRAPGGEVAEGVSAPALHPLQGAGSGLVRCVHTARCPAPFRSPSDAVSGREQAIHSGCIHSLRVSQPPALSALCGRLELPGAVVMMSSHSAGPSVSPAERTEREEEEKPRRPTWDRGKVSIVYLFLLGASLGYLYWGDHRATNYLYWGVIWLLTTYTGGSLGYWLPILGLHCATGYLYWGHHLAAGYLYWGHDLAILEA